VHVNEFIPRRRQPIVNQYFHPTAVLPKVEPKHSFASTTNGFTISEALTILKKKLQLTELWANIPAGSRGMTVVIEFKAPRKWR